MGSFLLGMGVGVIGGMLMAPTKGEHYRQILGEKACEGLDHLKSYTGNLRDSASGAVERGRMAVGTGIEKACCPPPAVYER